MIKVVAKLTINEIQIEEFKGYATELVAETRKEVGCITYQLFQDVNDLKIFTFIEEWKSKDALDQHIASQHFQTINPKISGTSVKDAEVNIYALMI